MRLAIRREDIFQIQTKNFPPPPPPSIMQSFDYFGIFQRPRPVIPKDLFQFTTYPDPFLELFRDNTEILEHCEVIKLLSALIDYCLVRGEVPGFIRELMGLFPLTFTSFVAAQQLERAGLLSIENVIALVERDKVVRKTRQKRIYSRYYDNNVAMACKELLGHENGLTSILTQGNFDIIVQAQNALDTATVMRCLNKESLLTPMVVNLMNFFIIKSLYNRDLRELYNKLCAEIIAQKNSELRKQKITIFIDTLNYVAVIPEINSYVALLYLAAHDSESTAYNRLPTEIILYIMSYVITGPEKYGKQFYQFIEAHIMRQINLLSKRLVQRARVRRFKNSGIYKVLANPKYSPNWPIECSYSNKILLVGSDEAREWFFLAAQQLFSNSYEEKHHYMNLSIGYKKSLVILWNQSSDKEALQKVRFSYPDLESPRVVIAVTDVAVTNSLKSLPSHLQVARQLSSAVNLFLVFRLPEEPLTADQLNFIHNYRKERNVRFCYQVSDTYAVKRILKDVVTHLMLFQKKDERYLQAHSALKKRKEQLSRQQNSNESPAVTTTATNSSGFFDLASHASSNSSQVAAPSQPASASESGNGTEQITTQDKSP